MSATLVLRTVKGSPLTNLEVDNNFSNLNTFAGVVNSNVGLLASLSTTSKSNLVFAVNELKSSLDAIALDSIANTTSRVFINGAAGNIIANVAGIKRVDIGNTNGNANIVVSGNVVANAIHTAVLADRSGRVLVILDQSNNIVWGS